MCIKIVFVLDNNKLNFTKFTTLLSCITKIIFKTRSILRHDKITNYQLITKIRFNFVDRLINPYHQLIFAPLLKSL